MEYKELERYGQIKVCADETICVSLSFQALPTLSAVAASTSVLEKPSTNAHAL